MPSSASAVLSRPSEHDAPAGQHQPPGGREGCAVNQKLPLASFWLLTPAQREFILLDGIVETHAWHFARNRAYRQTVAAHGVGPSLSPNDLARVLRPTAQTFKSYIDLLGTPFPHDRPLEFVEWLAGQLSIELPAARFSRLRPRYGSLEALLRAVEQIFADLGLEILTSSGTSGRATIMVRNQQALTRTTESFYLSFQRYFGMQADHRAIFIMPRQTRIAMARMAQFSVQGIGLAPERVHFTIPFAAQPDQVRIRAGRTFRSGWQGAVERRLWRPFMLWMGDAVVTPRAVQNTVHLLQAASAAGEKVLLFAGWTHLHAAAQEILRRGAPLRLAAGSLVGSGGGMKERYPHTPDEIRTTVAQAMILTGGEPVMVRDTYGMAEGNWAAMQCRQGNYHLPPWIQAFTVDGNDTLQAGADSVGLLAFFDPFGGGELFPAFFKTADRVRLLRGDAPCACGEQGAYLAQGSIQRVDLLDEAGCAAQL